MRHVGGSDKEVDCNSVALFLQARTYNLQVVRIFGIQLTQSSALYCGLVHSLYVNYFPEMPLPMLKTANQEGYGIDPSDAQSLVNVKNTFSI